MTYEDLSPELKEKALACKTPEQLLALAKEEGYELSDDELESLSGGAIWQLCETLEHNRNCDNYSQPHC